MSRFYGQTFEPGGRAKTRATRCGNRGIASSVQTWKGSLTVAVRDGVHGKPMFSISVNEETSGFGGKSIFYGTLDELIEKLNN